MPVVSGKQLIGYLDSNIQFRNTMIFLYSGDAQVEKYKLASPNVKAALPKSLDPMSLVTKIVDEYKKFSRKSYSDEVVGFLKEAALATVRDLFDCNPTADQVFNKRNKNTFGELSAMIPVFGLEFFGSVAVSMEKENIHHAISKFSDEHSDIIKESMMLDYIIDLANSLAGNIKSSLQQQKIETNIGIPFGKKGLRSDFPHLVTGPVLCIPVAFDGDVCFTEFCFGGFQKGGKTFNLFK